jgi:hypothetical protein
MGGKGKEKGKGERGKGKGERGKGKGERGKGGRGTNSKE